MEGPGEIENRARETRDSRFISRLTKETLVLIMAGGRGSRLMQLTNDRAKPCVPFGGKFRIIDFALSTCINSGLRRIGVLTQYKSHSLLRHLQHGWGFLRGQFGEFVELLPAEQRTESSSWYAGTADAVYQNIEFILAHEPRQVLVLAGDHIYKMDYGRMLAQHARSNAKVTIGCLQVPRMEATEFGVMQVDADGRVIGFQEKPSDPRGMPHQPDQALASMGIYVFDALYLLNFLRRDAGISESSHDFGKDIVPQAIHDGAVYAHVFTELTDHDKQGYWRDVGTVDSYWKANSTTRAGRSGPTSRSCRRPSSCSTTTTPAAWPPTPSSAAAASSLARGSVAACCSPARGWRRAPTSRSRCCCPACASAATA